MNFLSAEVTPSKTDGFNGTLYTIGTNWVQYNGTRICRIGNNQVNYDVTGRISSIGNNVVCYDKEGKIYQIGRNIVIYKGDHVCTVGNKMVQYINTNAK